MSRPADPDWPDCHAYLSRAIERGCSVVHVGHAADSVPLIAVTIVAPSGAAVTELVGHLGDRLASTTVARLDRRLGIKSRLFR